jgi:hypothetical protein
MARIEFLRSRDQDLLAAKFALPLLVILVGSIVALFYLGPEWRNWPETYLPIVGSLLSFIIVFRYMKLVVQPKGVSWSHSVQGFAGLIAYAFSLYVILYLGVHSFVRYSSVLSWAYAIVMIIMGYRFLSVFYKITELGRRLDEIQKDNPNSR